METQKESQLPAQKESQLPAQKESQLEMQLHVILVDDIFSLRNARVVGFDKLKEGRYDLRLVERGISTYYNGQTKKDIGEILEKPYTKAYICENKGGKK